MTTSVCLAWLLSLCYQVLGTPCGLSCSLEEWWPGGIFPDGNSCLFMVNIADCFGQVAQDPVRG